MNLSFRTTISNCLPPWFQARRLAGKVRAFKFFYTIALMGDGLMQNAYEGLQAQYPSIAPPEALPLIGRDRGIVRGINETNAAYAARLLTWLSEWDGAGNPFTIMRQVRAYLAPFTPRIRIVNDSGTWYTLEADGTTSIVQTWPSSNWVWDGNDAAHPTRFWIIIYSLSGPWSPTGNWGDGNDWGDRVRTWGTTATPDQVLQLRAIVDAWKSAGDCCQNIIIAFDGTSFDPTGVPLSAGLPDGTWGNWSKVVAGVRSPSRLGTARYFRGQA